MGSLGLSLPTFLYAISWGNQGCVSDSQVRAVRTALMNSKLLPRILQHWWKPPRSAASHKSRSKAARNVMEEFAERCLRDALERELAAVSEILRSSDDMSEEFFTGTVFDVLIEEVQHLAPDKSKEFRMLMIIAMLCYTRSHHSSRLQQIFAIYLNFRGLSAKAFDTLHALAFTMSHKWTADHVAKISQAAMKEVTDLMQLFPWLISYNNINIPFRVLSQRLDNKDEFGCGTAATVYIKRRAARLTAEINQDLQECRARGMKNPISLLEIFDLGQDSYPRIQKQATHHVLRFLLNAPEFQLRTYPYRDDPLLQAPPAVRALPHGPEHITLQYLLGSVNIAEASYADNKRLVNEWCHQANIRTMEEKKKIATEKVVAWVGDQLTVDRLQGLYKYHSQDDSSFDRLDWMVLIFGWFHLQMAFANSLHSQYLGTTSGRGLMQAFTLLKREGLSSLSVKGPFHLNLEEALYHLVVAGVSDLTELRTRNPLELKRLAKKLVREHASSEAMELNDYEVKKQTIMWNRDVLEYIHGDVGIMEDMLPHLLYRFMGGRNSKYAIEEWPSPVCDFIRENCWLVNFKGKQSSFLPIDMAQEHNIKDIKVTYKSEGPNIKWDYLKKLHPAIRVIRELSKHLEQEFKTLTCGKHHGTPKKDANPGRKHKGSAKDKAANYTTKGFVKLQDGHAMDQWNYNRNFARLRMEDWTIFSDDEEDNGSGS
ncbi:hypothetical protein BV22DRAFT_1107053 [Leucogyrophana mollusca]|uniref:Uncharacterized protein n=1 Tax=Leucogyrophana mollusca TaxID=85980 RepID=A0ACB8BAC4_9AGAM|nr:hypothetical protein BV22DRAFT_1107053 [Leucogyrophana mollusca]